MVSTSVTTHNENTITPIENSESFLRSKPRKASHDKAEKFTTPGMDSHREILHAKRVLEDSTALITNLRRSGTNAHYETASRKWHNQHSLNEILKLLTECFIMIYGHSIIAGFRSAISTYHNPISGIPIGKELWIYALLVGVHNIRSSQPSYTFI